MMKNLTESKGDFSETERATSQSIPPQAENGILIAGAGLAGLSLALALARRGVRSTVLEKQREISPSKWAILVYPQGLKFFDELGVINDMTDLGMPSKAAEVATIDGESLMISEDGLLFENRYNYHLLLGPSEMRRVLRTHALASGVQILEGFDCKGVIRDSRGTIIGAKVSKLGAKNAMEESTSQISCRLLIGADGYRSNLRKELMVHFKERFHKSLVTAFFVNYLHHLDRMKMLLGDGYMIALLPCTESRLCLGYTERSLTRDSLEDRGGQEYVKKRIADALPYLSDAIREASPNFSDGSMISFHPAVVRVTPWIVDGGVLIGDAAHSFHPGTGSGAQQALADSLALAPIVEKCAKMNDFSLTALSEYEKIRGPFVRLLQNSGELTISMELAKGRFNRWFRNRFFRTANKLITKKQYQEVFSGVRPPTRRESFSMILKLFLP
jgi:6-methylpretetramide 4-monooxygenase